MAVFTAVLSAGVKEVPDLDAARAEFDEDLAKPPPKVDRNRQIVRRALGVA